MVLISPSFCAAIFIISCSEGKEGNAPSSKNCFPYAQVSFFQELSIATFVPVKFLSSL